MVGMFGQMVLLGQANGPDVDLVVRGSELSATYETPDGFPSVYDERQGLFCFARLAAGRLESTGVPVSEPLPAGVARHAEESAAVRQERTREGTRKMEQRAQEALKRDVAS